MSLASVAAEYEAYYRARVEAATWGHLAAKPHIEYFGYMVFTQSSYGDLTIIHSEFKELPDSPWFYDAMQDFLWKKAKDCGCVYRFDGTYKVYKTGRSVFKGKVKKLWKPD